MSWLLCCRELPATRQSTLLETLAAAASLMTPAEKQRPGAGPPPLLSCLRPLKAAPHLAARPIDFAAVKGAGEGSAGPFIFTPFDASKKAEDASTPLEWLCGEVASVEVEISNPTAVPIKVCASTSARSSRVFEQLLQALDVQGSL